MQNGTHTFETDLAIELVQSMAELLRGLKFDRHLVSKSFEAALSKRRTGNLHPRGRAASRLHVGNILTEWHRNPHYLDRSGEPRPLHFSNGRYSYSSLSKSSCKDLSPQETRRILLDARAIEIRNDLIFARDRAAIISTRSVLAHVRAVEVATNLSQTLVQNISSRGAKKLGQFERTVICDSIDARYLPALQTYIDQHGQAFLEQIDDWIAARSSSGRKRPTGRRLSVGAGVFLFSRRSRKVSESY